MKQPQFTTRQQLLRSYADLLDRHEKARLEGLPPWRYDNLPTHKNNAMDMPAFDCESSLYELPVAICEGKHVWLGDKLYTGTTEAVAEEIGIRFKSGHLIGWPEFNASPADLWSWTKEEQKVEVFSGGRHIVSVLAYLIDGELRWIAKEPTWRQDTWIRVPSEDKEITL